MNSVAFISFPTQADTTSEMTSTKVDNDLSVPPLGNVINTDLFYSRSHWIFNLTSQIGEPTFCSGKVFPRLYTSSTMYDEG